MSLLVIMMVSLATQSGEASQWKASPAPSCLTTTQSWVDAQAAMEAGDWSRAAELLEKTLFAPEVCESLIVAALRARLEAVRGTCDRCRSTVQWLLSMEPEAIEAAPFSGMPEGYILCRDGGSNRGRGKLALRVSRVESRLDIQLIDDGRFVDRLEVSVEVADGWLRQTVEARDQVRIDLPPGGGPVVVRALNRWGGVLRTQRL